MVFHSSWTINIPVYYDASEVQSWFVTFPVLSFCFLWKHGRKWHECSPWSFSQHEHVITDTVSLWYHCTDITFGSCCHSARSDNVLHCTCLSKCCCGLCHTFYYLPRVLQSFSVLCCSCTHLSFASLFLCDVLTYPILSQHSLKDCLSWKKCSVGKE
jgi:hypothetical protein